MAENEPTTLNEEQQAIVLDYCRLHSKLVCIEELALLYVNQMLFRKKRPPQGEANQYLRHCFYLDRQGLSSLNTFPCTFKSEAEEVMWVKLSEAGVNMRSGLYKWPGVERKFQFVNVMYSSSPADFPAECNAVVQSVRDDTYTKFIADHGEISTAPREHMRQSDKDLCVSFLDLQLSVIRDIVQRAENVRREEKLKVLRKEMKRVERIRQWLDYTEENKTS